MISEQPRAAGPGAPPGAQRPSRLLGPAMLLSLVLLGLCGYWLIALGSGAFADVVFRCAGLAAVLLGGLAGYLLRRSSRGGILVHRGRMPPGQHHG